MALVLTRKVGDKVVIELEDGRLIQVVLVSAGDGKGGTARIGFECDRSIGVHRGEVWNRILAERKAGAA
jgi:carbon storage regulator CsrA